MMTTKSFVSWQARVPYLQVAWISCLHLAWFSGLWFPLAACSGTNSLCSGMEKMDVEWTPSCNQSHVRTCSKTKVNMKTLLMQEIHLPGNIKMKIHTRGQYSAVFKDSSLNEAVFAWTPMGSLAGHISMDGHSYMLESCGTDCFVWVQNDQHWKDEVEVEPDSDPHLEIQDYKTVLDVEDSDSVVDYSVMVWYTPEFRQHFSDENAMNVFIDLIFVETNQGYANSQIPVRANKMCVRQHPTLHDVENPTTMIDNFASSMSASALHNSGDAAVLLVGDFGACGVAYPKTTRSCRTFSVVQKSCATGYYSFGHEIGHNFGAKHNPEVSKEEGYPGHGYLIQPPGSGYRTILAYQAEGHKTRINYYSNPRVLLPHTGTSTGQINKSDNARVITNNRFAMAACGDETLANQCTGSDSSSSCPYLDSYSQCPSWRNPHCTTGQFVKWMDYYCTKTCRCSVSSGLSTPSCRTVQGVGCVFPFRVNGVSHSACTMQGGYNTPWCSTRTDQSGNHILGNYGDCSSTCPRE